MLDNCIDMEGEEGLLWYTCSKEVTEMEDEKIFICDIFALLASPQTRREVI